MKQIRILIADDQPLMRDGLKTVIDLEKDFNVVGTARNGREAIHMADSLKPDIILMDIRMPELDGVESIKAIKVKHPAVKVLMLTTFNDDEYIMQALAAGASGYLLKDIEVDSLLESIRSACADNLVMPAAVAAKLAEGLKKIVSRRAGNPGLDRLCLTDREKEIARMLVQGFTNRQISAALYLSEGTARNYISAIYEKIGTSERTKAVLYLKELGLD